MDRLRVVLRAMACTARPGAMGSAFYIPVSVRFRGQCSRAALEPKSGRGLPPFETRARCSVVSPDETLRKQRRDRYNSARGRREPRGWPLPVLRLLFA